MNEKIRNSWDKIQPSEIQKEKMRKQIVMQSKKKKKSEDALNLVLIGIIVLLLSIKLVDLYQRGEVKNTSLTDLNADADQIFINQMDIEKYALDIHAKGEMLEIDFPLNSLPSQPKLAYVWSIAISTEDCLGCYNLLYQYNLFFEDKAKDQRIELMISDKGIPLRCIRYPEEGLKESVMQGIPVTILQTNQFYYLFFEHEGIACDLEFHNMNQDEMLEWMNAFLHCDPTRLMEQLHHQKEA